MNDYYKVSIFDRVTQKIIADLEQGVRPWQKPWDNSCAAAPLRRPQRHNGEHYNGVNILLLWDAALSKGYQNPIWMTFKQAEEYGARVRKGERASWIVYANKVHKTETDPQTGGLVEKQIPFLRGYSVFNAEQVEGLPEKFLNLPATPRVLPGFGRLDHVDTFMKKSGALIRQGGDRAYYAEGDDFIQMPVLEAFRDRESYYAVLTHEITHWTKHKDRLNRNFGQIVWGDEAYAKEELVAELGSAFLCADLGITPEIRDDHASYIASWLHALKNDKKLIFAAAAHASRALTYLKELQTSLVPDIQTDKRGVPSIKRSTPVQQLTLSL